MVKLSWWQQFIIGSGLSFLMVLEGKITNQTERAGLESAIAFLNRLLAGQVNTA